MERDGRWWIQLGRLVIKWIETWKYTMKYDESKWIILGQKETERNWMYHKVEVLLRNITGDDEPNQDGLEQNGSQNDSTLWSLIGINESYWDEKELEGSQRGGFAMEHGGIWWIQLGRIRTERIRMDGILTICYETWWELTNHIGTESNWIYCNMKVSIWNVMRGDESDRIVNKCNGL